MAALEIRTHADVIYRETITALRSEIEATFGSVKSYCEQSQHGLSRHNLSRVFNWKQDLALTTYCKMVDELNILGRPMPVLPDDIGVNLSLRQYLVVDTHAVQQSIMALTFETHRNIKPQF